MITMNLKKKIPKLLMIPLILLFTYSIYSGFNKLEEKSTYENLSRYMKFTTISSDLIHELQKERGYSSGFIASKGKSFAIELNLQRELTNKKLKHLKYFLNNFNSDNYKFSFQNDIKTFLFSLQRINDIRKSIDNNELSSIDTMQYYTHSIEVLLKLIENIITISHDSEIAILTQSYITLIKTKEKAGVERALINRVFSKGELSSNELYEFGALVAAQDIYIKYFKSIAKNKHVNIFNKVMLISRNNEITKERNIVYTKNKKNEILSDIKEHVGYGGLIHDFKNYVIRGKNKYSYAVKEQYSQLLLAINEYKMIDGVTKEELDKLNIIKNVFLQYRNGLEKVTISYKNGDSISDLDKIVKVDNKPSIKALNELTTKIYGSHINWFEHSTDRINALKNIEDELASDLHVMIEKSNISLMFDLVTQFILLLVVLIIIFLLFQMLRELIESEKILRMAQENTKSASYEYYIKEDFIIWSDEHYKLLEVDKKTFKPSFRTFAVFVHPDDADILEAGMKTAISSKEISFYDYRIILYDGTIKYVRSSSEVVKYNNKGEPLVVIGTVVDVTSFKKLEQEIVDTQKDVIFTMGAIGETRSKETGLHVKRVAEYSKLLYLLHGAQDDEAELLKMASPMHDIGKVGIPDNILHKPGKLTPGEWAIMQTHSEMGYDMLKNSHREILQLAATVAYTHHEKYDGTGYPRGLVANEIPLVGRITALADVFDALGSDRCYKSAWELEEILKLIKDEKAKQFDPHLVDLFLNNLDKFLEIRDRYIDEF